MLSPPLFPSTYDMRLISKMSRRSLMFLCFLRGGEVRANPEPNQPSWGLTHSTSNCVLFMFLSSFFIYSFAERARLELQAAAFCWKGDFCSFSFFPFQIAFRAVTTQKGVETDMGFTVSHCFTICHPYGNVRNNLYSEAFRIQKL